MTPYGLELSSDLTPRSLSVHCECSVLPNPLLNQGFASLCPCQDYSLEVFTGDKDWLLNSVSIVTSISESKWGWL